MPGQFLGRGMLIPASGSFGYAETMTVTSDTEVPDMLHPRSLLAELISEAYGNHPFVTALAKSDIFHLFGPSQSVSANRIIRHTQSVKLCPQETRVAPHLGNGRGGTPAVDRVDEVGDNNNTILGLAQLNADKRDTQAPRPQLFVIIHSLPGPDKVDEANILIGMNSA
ncbi:hypothetical protein PCH_Pc21g20120 [Penicillium rubens Wisconsin 54-1255]|uniref:Uncharacterized protein n=1 Tax=Penicillium rubens (strain ATCC 28089 / DSM 1075 / NRRL 1951 / Wisconsin 54-1255) TaxID=500485 RepID=B6HKA6_PENRW|nr:hypothetical protein PCH_Pc21g20120 [Penicillium rubens Wisconsin 54-1255]